MLDPPVSSKYPQTMEMTELKFGRREFPKETFMGYGYERSEPSSSGADTVYTYFTLALFLQSDSYHS